MRVSVFLALGLLGIGIAAFALEYPLTVWEQAAAWVGVQHDVLHQMLTHELYALRGQDAVGWMLVLMSFLYGALHAAGPGHGKAVLTTYLLTHRDQLNRAVAMGTLAALLQGVTALVLVYGLTSLAGWLPREAETATVWAERMSFALLAVVGVYLCVRALPGLVDGIHRWQHMAHQHEHDEHGHAGHVHGTGCSCRHVPSAAEIDTAGNQRIAAGVVLAIGLRPCSGAVLVLILASVMGLAWHGAFAVFAMSVGTAITIVTLAVFAAKAREWASAWVEHESPVWALAGGGIGALGGAALVLMGLLLLSASFVGR